MGSRRKDVAQKKGEDMRQKNAQTWSIDLIMGVIIFMLIIAIFYAFLSTNTKPKLEQLKDDALITSKKNANNAETLGLVKEGIISEARFDELCDMPYEELKRELGIENDVCIYLEDEQGNVILCGNGNQAGIGNGEDIIISTSSGNIACGAPVS
jgi:hypothetical protein